MIEENSKVIPVYIEEEMKKSYIDYSMSVIISRAIPDVRDGMKPVHRRVLYGLHELGLSPNSAYKKSARIVGEVLGKYHPHGDTAVYDTMVRLAQDFSMRYPLVDGQGNFGSVDGDSAAAMRYTEARLTNIAQEVLRDLEKDTVDFVPNFDETLQEPSVLPSLLPNLLVNGAYGIAVGMATNIPTHNLNEVIDALTALISNPKLRPSTLRKYLQGPDFPTGGIIYGDKGIDEYFKTGRGKMTVRARAHVEEMRGGRERIVVTEIPYQVNKASLQEKAAKLVRDKKLEGITEIRDESDREGMRVVFELRKDIDSTKMLKELFKHTQMETTFGVIMLSLVNGQPKTLNMKDVLTEFLNFRHDVVLRRTRYELDKAEKRAHILEGYLIALDNIDEVIAIIKKSRSVDTARRNLMKRFKLSEVQAQAILDMRLQRLTGLERKKIQDEYRDLLKLIERLKSLLASKALRMQLIKDELQELKEKYGDARRTQIVSSKAKQKSGSLQELIREDQTIVTISHKGTISRFSVSDYEIDKNLIHFSGTDFTQYTFLSANSHHLLFFTNRGRCHPLRTSFVPMINGSSGADLNRLLQLQKGETIVDVHEIDSFDENRFVTMASQQGQIKRMNLSTLSTSKEGSFAVMSLKDTDKVVSSVITSGKNDVLMATAHGMAIRFSEQNVRDMGLTAAGVRGIALDKDDTVVSLIPLTKKKSSLFTVTNLGYGKRSALSEYAAKNRAGKGIINFRVTESVGKVVSVLEVQNKDSIFLITRKHRVKRLRAKSVKLTGRNSKPAALASFAKGDELVDAKLKPQDSF